MPRPATTRGAACGRSVGSRRRLDPAPDDRPGRRDRRRLGRLRPCRRRPRRGRTGHRPGDPRGRVDLRPRPARGPARADGRGGQQPPRRLREAPRRAARQRGPAGVAFRHHGRGRRARRAPRHHGRVQAGPPRLAPRRRRRPGVRPPGDACRPAARPQGRLGRADQALPGPVAAIRPAARVRRDLHREARPRAGRTSSAARSWSRRSSTSGPTGSARS